jgi:hypothetical protein
MPGKQILSIEIVDHKNSLSLIEIEVLPIDLNNVLLFPTPIFKEARIKTFAYSRKNL